MKRSTLIVAAVAFALALSTTAWAGTVGYYSSPYWSPGGGGSSSFSSTWWRNVMTKNANFESTVTFIDNVTYGWHATLRGTNPYLATHWLSSHVKKAHCRANASSSAWAGCAVTN